MPRQSDARQRIIDSAIERFRSCSYSGVGVQELCDHAGVNKGSFYHFFPSKRELAVAALEQLWRCHRESTWEVAFDPALAPLDRIARLFELVEAQKRMEQGGVQPVCGCTFGSMAAELATQDEAIRRKVEITFAEMREFIRDAVAATARADAVDDLADLVLANLQGALLLAKTRNDPGVLTRVGASLVALLRNEKKAPVTAAPYG